MSTLYVDITSPGHAQVFAEGRGDLPMAYATRVDATFVTETDGGTEIDARARSYRAVAVAYMRHYKLVGPWLVVITSEATEKRTEETIVGAGDLTGYKGPPSEMV